MTANYLYPPAPTAHAKVKGDNRFYPINRLFFVGRNYAAHAAEMGVKSDKEHPFYFTKSPTTLVQSGATIPYPPGTENFHYEMELVVAMGKPAFQVTEDEALVNVFGYACGLDMTRRDLQLIARDKGRPWDLGKDMEDGSVLAEIIPASQIGHPSKGAITLSVNGETKQSADIADLINNVQEVISHLSQFYHLDAGDLIYTGTPAGVGPIVSGDQLEGSIEGVGTISLSIG